MIERIISPEAKADLRDAWWYLDDQRSEEAADRQEDMLFEAFTQLVKMPMLGNLKPEWTRRSVRFWLVGNYWIVYRAEVVPLEIVRVLHTSRDIPALL